jgi:hypothetical protein
VVKIVKSGGRDGRWLHTCERKMEVWLKLTAHRLMAVDLERRIQKVLWPLPISRKRYRRWRDRPGVVMVISCLFDVRVGKRVVQNTQYPTQRVANPLGSSLQLQPPTASLQPNNLHQPSSAASCFSFPTDTDDPAQESNTDELSCEASCLSISLC